MHTLALRLLPLATAHLGAQPAAQPPADITIDSALVIRPAMRGGRSPVFTDPVEHLLVRGQWQPPREGETLGDGELSTWQRLEANEAGSLSHAALAGGYAFASVQSTGERIALLDARGHRHVYVNGEPRAGDVYDNGSLRIPIKLREGENEFLFRGGRGRLRAVITEPPAPVFIETRDMTLPDVIAGEELEAPLLAGIIITNATEEWVGGLQITASINGAVVSETRVALIGPLTLRKVPVEISIPPGLAGDDVKVTLQLRMPDHVGERERFPSFSFLFPESLGTQGDLLHEETITLRIRQPHQTHKRTFISTIDGSVQYYAVTPMPPGTPRERTGDDAAGRELPALFLSLHGASVEALGQAQAYAPKAWGHIVAPTNRRPFGFDWEDWGRMDALEVLHLAAERFGTDPRRTYLTGHSMGGHGTWQLGVHYPGLFAAIAPSAGWPDFWSYTGAPAWPEGTPVERLLHRSMNPSRTRELVRNLEHGEGVAKSGGVYILHGDADDNVPVAQARMMREALAKFHTNFAYYEQPGAGHWWGNECVDWPPLFDFLRQNTRPEDHQVARIDFTTANPAISSRSYWAIIEQQVLPLEFSRLQATIDVRNRRITAGTSNIAQLAFDLSPFRSATESTLSGTQSFTIEIDGQTVEAAAAAGDLLRLSRGGGEQAPWTVTGALNTAHKHPGRAGPFKEAFQNNVVLVVGTFGTPEETEALYQRARFDAETFLYRGNAAPLIIPDVLLDLEAVGISHGLTAPVRSPVSPGDNIILYGNAENNAAFALLDAASPITIRRGRITIGDRTLAGDDLACLFIYPWPGTPGASIGVVGATGPAGLQLTTQLPYFVSGVAYPDWIVLGPEMLQSHTAGMRAAGFFSNDWTLGDDAAWREE
jgi:dienelactone hydrolase